MSSQVWTIHCDGTALPNPGRMGIGALIVAPDGTRHTLSQATGGYGCNNEAEVRALSAALREVRRLGADVVCICCDSSIVVEQLGAIPVAPIARLVSVFDEARQLLQAFAYSELRWVPRHRNSEADALARAALGLGIKPPKRASRRRK